MGKLRWAYCRELTSSRWHSIELNDIQHGTAVSRTNPNAIWHNTILGSSLNLWSIRLPVMHIRLSSRNTSLHMCLTSNTTLAWVANIGGFLYMMTSSNGNIFRVTGPLCGEFAGPGEFPTQRPVTRSFDVFCDLRHNKPLSKQPWGWWCETLSHSLWRHRNVWYTKPADSLKMNSWKSLANAYMRSWNGSLFRIYPTVCCLLFIGKTGMGSDLKENAWIRATLDLWGTFC